MHTIRLSDGRDLSYEVYGDPDGVPVIFNHGLSDSRVIRNPDDSLTSDLGVRLISPDQPGVGGSSPKRGRKMVDWGEDVEQLADSLGLESFNVAGHSGGGPHALSIAVRMPERVEHVTLASPVTPFDEPGVHKMLVMRDLKELAETHRMHRLVRWGMRIEAEKILKDLPRYMRSIAKEDPSDAETFYRSPEQEAMFEDEFREGLAQGEEGMYEMTEALWDWGFAPSDVEQDVEIFYGDADDMISPRMPLHLADELPHATTHVWPGAGHYGFVDRERWMEFMTTAAR